MEETWTYTPHLVFSQDLNAKSIGSTYTFRASKTKQTMIFKMIHVQEGTQSYQGAICFFFLGLDFLGWTRLPKTRGWNIQAMGSYKEPWNPPFLPRFSPGCLAAKFKGWCRKSIVPQIAMIEDILKMLFESLGFSTKTQVAGSILRGR